MIGRATHLVRRQEQKKEKLKWKDGKEEGQINGGDDSSFLDFITFTIRKIFAIDFLWTLIVDDGLRHWILHTVPPANFFSNLSFLKFGYEIFKKICRGAVICSSHTDQSPPQLA